MHLIGITAYALSHKKVGLLVILKGSNGLLSPGPSMNPPFRSHAPRIRNPEGIRRMLMVFAFLSVCLISVFRFRRRYQL